MTSPREIRAIAVQPHWRIQHYRTAGAFRRWMHAQLQQASAHLAPGRPNLVVLTELNGLPLLLRGAHLASRAPTLQGAMALLLLKHLPATLLIAWRQRVSPQRALQWLLAPGVARAYLRTCRELARQHRVHLACGTAPLPHFRLVNGALLAEPARVYNQAVLLDPQGNLIGLSDKVHLTPDELREGLDLSPGDLAQLRVYPTAAGELGVAISLDAFRSDVTAHLDAQQCSVLLQPDANAVPWTEKERVPPSGRDQPHAWLDSAWAAVQNARHIRYAINPMVVGNLLGVPFDGQSAITARSHEAPAERGYVMTTPRAGFLALHPWVTDGDHQHLRATALALAPRSRHALENRYRTGVIHADLRLPPRTRPPAAHQPHEQAIQQYLAGRASLPDPAVLRASRVLWPTLAATLTLSGARQFRRGRRRGLPLALAGAALLALATL